QKLCVSVIRSQWNTDCAQRFPNRSSPECVRRNIAGHNCSRSYDRTFTNSYIGQNNAMWPNEHILFDYNFSIADRLSRTRVNVRDDRCSKPNHAVVANDHVFRVYFIDVYVLAYPNILANRNAAQTLQPRSDAESSRSKQSDFPDN